MVAESAYDATALVEAVTYVETHCLAAVWLKNDKCWRVRKTPCGDKAGMGNTLTEAVDSLRAKLEATQ